MKLTLSPCLLFPIVLALSGGTTGPASAATAAQTLEDRQQAACYDDAQRLCPDEFPDVDAVKACMADKKSKVSPACQAFYPPGAK